MTESQIINDAYFNISIVHFLLVFFRGRTLSGYEGGTGGFYNFFQKTIRSPGDHRPKYFMAQ